MGTKYARRLFMELKYKIENKIGIWYGMGEGNGAEFFDNLFHLNLNIFPNSIDPQ